jgi:hypothetical protein
MTKTTKFAMTTAWILFSRSYDAYCTNLLTPDLSKESNPLVSILGMTWTPLLLTISILTLYAIYTYYLTVFKPKTLLPDEKGYSFSNIVAYTYLGEKGEWTSLFYKLPKELSRFNYYMGYTLSKCLVFAGFVSTIMWLLINHSDYYKTIHSATMIYSIIIVGGGIIIYQWHKQQYKQYLIESQ